MMRYFNIKKISNNYMHIINYLAIIPARSGSKGLLNKNIKKIKGKTLIEITAENAEKSDKIDGIFFSSDSNEYIDIYKRLNLSKDVTNKYIRSFNLSLDTSSSYEYILDCVNYLNKNDIKVKNFIILQVTSPLRQYYHINEAIEMYESNNCESLVSICESFNHPYNSFIKNNNLYECIIKDKFNRRQEYPKSVSLNGAIYIKNTDEYLKTKGKIINDKTFYYEMDKLLSIDIDTEKEFILAELIYLNYLK